MGRWRVPEAAENNWERHAEFQHSGHSPTIENGLIMAVTIRSEQTRFTMKTMPWSGFPRVRCVASRMVVSRSRLPAVPTTAATPSTVTYSIPSRGLISSNVAGPRVPLLTNDARSIVESAPRVVWVSRAAGAATPSFSA